MRRKMLHELDVLRVENARMEKKSMTSENLEAEIDR